MKNKQILTFLIGIGLEVLVLSGAVRGASVVLDQIGDSHSYNLGPGHGLGLSQIFNGAYANDSSMVIDDFTVTASALRVSSVTALFRADVNFAQFANVDGFAVAIFSSVNQAKSSLTGDVGNLLVLYGSGASVTRVTDPNGNFAYGLVRLDVDIVLPAAGKYWLGVAPKSAVNDSETFRLLNSGASAPATPGGSNAKFVNPANGFGNGALSDLSVDAAYSLTVVPEPGAACFLVVGSLAFLASRKRTSPRCAGKR